MQGRHRLQTSDAVGVGSVQLGPEALTLAAILHQYDLEPKPGYQLQVAETLTLKPADFQLRLHPRRRHESP